MLPLKVALFSVMRLAFNVRSPLEYSRPETSIPPPLLLLPLIVTPAKSPLPSSATPELVPPVPVMTSGAPAVSMLPLVKSTPYWPVLVVPEIVALLPNIISSPATSTPVLPFDWPVTVTVPVALSVPMASTPTP